MRRNLVLSLFEHETISTTMEKAKEVKSFAEKLITLAKKGTLAARRKAISMLGNRDIVSHEDGNTGKLFSELGPRYLDRPGGYTRIIRLSLRRLGDNGQLVLLQLVGADEDVVKKERHTPAETKSPDDNPEVEKNIDVDESEETAEVEEVVAEETTEEETAIQEEGQSDTDEKQG
jgi:large subunit ribosomal protein L17